jgi:hypothetical protein
VGGPGSILGATRFSDVVGLERGPLSLVSTTEELLEKEKVAAPVWKAENTAIGIRYAEHVAPSNCKKLALTLPTRDGSPVGIVRSRAQATEFVLDLRIQVGGRFM